MHMTHFQNDLTEIPCYAESKKLECLIIQKSLKATKQKGLNRIVKINEDHL